jgi:hypothetical protein
MTTLKKMTHMQKYRRLKRRVIMLAGLFKRGAADTLQIKACSTNTSDPTTTDFLLSAEKNIWHWQHSRILDRKQQKKTDEKLGKLKSLSMAKSIQAVC